MKSKYAASVAHHNFLMRYLKNKKTAVDYLNTSLKESDENAFLLALHHVAQAQGGISKVARNAKIHRVSLHRILSNKGNPRLCNLTNILNALGLKLTVTKETKSKFARAA